MSITKSKLWNYVYRITNIEINKHYYGCRSSNVCPKEDLGKKYFSSSRDKDFIKEQEENPSKFKYKIIKTFIDRESAILFERKIQIKFNVSSNSNFYNKSIQTSTGFDSSGKCMVNLNGKNTLVEKEEYFKNKNDYGHHIRGKVSAINTLTGERLLVSKDEFEKNKNLRGVTIGNLVCIDKITGEIKYISKQMFEENRDKYNHINHNRIVDKKTIDILKAQRRGFTTMKGFDGKCFRIHENDIIDSYEIGSSTSKRYHVTSNTGEIFKVTNLKKFLKLKNLPPHLNNGRDRKRILDKNGYVKKFSAKKYESPVGWRFVCID